MQFDEPIEFREAVRQLAAKKLMPTNLTSAELSALNKQVMRTSFTSAQTSIEALLDKYKTGVGNLINPSGEAGADFNPAKLRAFIKDYLREISYRDAGDSVLTKEAGDSVLTKDVLTNLASDKRINLMIKTNVELAQGAGKLVQSNANEDVVDLWPAWELVRYEEKEKPRDWPQRWRLASQVAGDVDAARVLEETGRMVALKSSEIWQELGDGAGGYMDTLGNPYPPFAFNSGMWTDDVSRHAAEELGLLEAGEKAEPADFDIESLFKAAA